MVDNLNGETNLMDGAIGNDSKLVFGATKNFCNLRQAVLRIITGVASSGRSGIEERARTVDSLAYQRQCAKAVGQTRTAG